ncbi:MAG: hypothetical protein ABI870_09230 [Rhodanobacter sp.]
MSLQYLRTCNLTIGDDAGDILDLSEFHIRFTTTSGTTSTLKYAEVRVWNLAEDTANLVQTEFTKITLRAGYGGNNAIIFKGQIGRIEKGREDSVNAYLDLYCQDGDKGKVWSVTNATLANGHTDDQVYEQLMKDFGRYDLHPGYKPSLGQEKSIGGYSMFGTTADYMQRLADKNDCDWFIEDGTVNLVPRKSFLPSTSTPSISSQTGLIGTAAQTFDGINLKCLLNPSIRTGCPFKLDTGSINTLVQKQPLLGEEKLVVPDIDKHEIYKALCVAHEGDTRGQEWYTTLIGVSVDGTVPNQGPAFNSVPSGS